MKRIVVLLSISCLLLTGCSVVKVNTNIDGMIDTIMNSSNKLYNVYFDGYKYYLPKGLKFINKEEYNALFRDKFNVNYYLYVDIISYYHKTVEKYTEKASIFYSKELNYNKKYGYLEIKEVEDKYYIQCMYNYAKIEVYTDKNHLNNTICNIFNVLKSIDYNDKILDSLVGENKLNYKEETFNIFHTQTKKDNFLNYGNEDHKEETDDVKDDDYINIEEDLES